MNNSSANEGSVSYGELYTLYQKIAPQPMRPYTPGEDMSGISVSDEDTPGPGGMIAINPTNFEDKWYVAKEFFEANYREVLKAQ